MSPIIQAIDADHVEHHGKCVACCRKQGIDVYADSSCGTTVWPCRVMVLARNAHRKYVNELTRNAEHKKALAVAR